MGRFSHLCCNLVLGGPKCTGTEKFGVSFRMRYEIETRAMIFLSPFPTFLLRLYNLIEYDIFFVTAFRLQYCRLFLKHEFFK